MRYLIISLGLLVNLPSWACPDTPPQTERPEDFVPLRAIAPNIQQDLRYISSDNFLGRPVAGYAQAQCWLTRPAAKALAKVQAELETEGLGLKVFDCYRPQRAVDDFMRWADGPVGPNAKLYYPDVHQSQLIPQGYIAACSGHSRGSTVDLTIIYKNPALGPEAGNLRGCAGSGAGELNMGSGYDCFGPYSHTLGELVAGEVRENRWRLKQIMERHGFKNFRKEWWHYTLIDEPDPATWFDFLPD
ncbi:MAG: M15 family metallopeptidase [Salinisphaeraceae bacterium]|nr:M15 family metallopeptidase [Salinisphaeraceae bacterium]